MGDGPDESLFAPLIKWWGKYLAARIIITLLILALVVGTIYKLFQKDDKDSTVVTLIGAPGGRYSGHDSGFGPPPQAENHRAAGGGTRPVAEDRGAAAGGEHETTRGPRMLTISGHIFDEEGTLLDGVSIAYRGSIVGVSSKGYYSLQLKETSDAEGGSLTFSKIGFVSDSRVVEWPQKLEKSVSIVDVSLKSSQE